MLHYQDMFFDNIIVMRISMKCSKEFTRTGIIKHLDSCKERIEAEKDIKTNKTTGYFELLITAKYQKEYWIVIEIEDTDKLEDLDQFIRDNRYCPF